MYWIILPNTVNEPDVFNEPVIWVLPFILVVPSSVIVNNGTALEFCIRKEVVEEVVPVPLIPNIAPNEVLPTADGKRVLPLPLLINHLEAPPESSNPAPDPSEPILPMEPPFEYLRKFITAWLEPPIPPTYMFLSSVILNVSTSTLFCTKNEDDKEDVVAPLI